MREHGVQHPSWGGFTEARTTCSPTPPHPALTEIGKAYDKSAAQVVLRWLIQGSAITIPKSVRPGPSCTGLRLRGPPGWSP
ncbi:MULTISPECIES: hypothetical protein [Streptomyces]|uniref:NADP-dependent oxidoreductase domain-containing protein n=1 Tax=Streptomyces flaveolus TaxID=67297 RepID=A0ABV3AJV0_9ACTN|nr:MULTISPECIES: hypothetical protein [Streptomyces]